MPDETKTQGNHIIIQNITDSTITLTVDGELREIQNQLAELKSLVESLKAQKVQYAEKIYNIGHINEANFGFFTGKKTFNEQLTKRLITAIAGYCPPARTFLENAEKIQEWESQARISDKAKEIIAYSFVGVIGIQLSKLMAIGKEDFSDAKQRKYIQKCIQIAKWSLNLVNFALLSRLWDAQKQNPHALPSHLQTILASYFNTPFEWTIEEQFLLLKTFAEIFNTQGVGLAYPIKEVGRVEGTIPEWQRFASALSQPAISERKAG